MIVIDASVAVKWYFREPNSDAARVLFAKADQVLHAPDILLTEVTGAFVRRANERSVTELDVRRAIDLWIGAWSEGRIVTHRLTALLVDQAARMAIMLGHPLSDCIYLALASDLRCDLVTADVKFRSRALPLYPAIRLLADER